MKRRREKKREEGEEENETGNAPRGSECRRFYSLLLTSHPELPKMESRPNTAIFLIWIPVNNSFLLEYHRKCLNSIRPDPISTSRHRQRHKTLEVVKHPPANRHPSPRRRHHRPKPWPSSSAPASASRAASPPQRPRRPPSPTRAHSPPSHAAPCG